MIGKDMIIQTICDVFRGKAIQVIEDGCHVSVGTVKIAGRTFLISIHEVKEEQ